MKTVELTGALLDYWVARAEGKRAWFTRLVPDAKPMCSVLIRWDNGDETAQLYGPSTNWAQGGPLIEKYKLGCAEDRARVWIAVRPTGPNYDRSYWCIARAEGQETEGDTPLQAIYRAVVRAAFGDEVEEVARC